MAIKHVVCITVGGVSARNVARLSREGSVAF